MKLKEEQRMAKTQEEMVVDERLEDYMVMMRESERNDGNAVECKEQKQQLYLMKN